MKREKERGDGHEQAKHKRFERVRRLKKLLRYMPRRAMLHKYPGLKYFAGQIRKRDYLWSFREGEVTRAFYVGFIITMLPVFGVQGLLSLVFSCIFRANFMIAFALQFVSNAFTIPFIFAADFYIGHLLMNFVSPGEKTIGEVYQHFKQLNWSGMLEKMAQCYLEMTIGGVIFGAVCAVVAVFIYKRVAHYFSPHH